MPSQLHKTGLFYLLAVLFSLGALASSSFGAPRTKSKTATPTARQESVPTDRTPTDKNHCEAIARALNDRVKSLSKTTRQVVPQEFTRVASDLARSCDEADFSKAWISIEWMNGCLDNFTKSSELGFCSKNEGYLCAINPKAENCAQDR